MNRFLKCESEIIIGSNEVVIELIETEIPFLTLEMSLIMMGLSKKLSIVFQTKQKLILCVDESLSLGESAIITKEKNTLIVNLSENHIEYFHMFLLKTYRDKIAEVNHIHIEGKMDSKLYDLTFLFENYIEPMTPEQAEKLMND